MTEVMHLVGDFQPAVLDRWTQWAKLNGYTVRHTTLAEIEQLGITGKQAPLIIMDDHGLNDLPLPTGH